MLEEIINIGVQWIPNGLKQDILQSPVYTALAPVRHYIGGLLFRNTAEKAYQYLTKKKESLNILSHPLSLYLFSASPDLDSIVGLEHRGATHSLAFAGAIGLGAMALAIFKKKKPLGMYFALPFAATLSHLAVDMFIEGGDPLSPLWPITQERNVQILTNYESIGHAFTLAGLAYMWVYYDLQNKLLKFKQKVAN